MKSPPTREDVSIALASLAQCTAGVGECRDGCDSSAARKFARPVLEGILMSFQSSSFGVIGAFSSATDKLKAIGLSFDGHVFQLAGHFEIACQWIIKPTQPAVSQIDGGRENQRLKSVVQTIIFATARRSQRRPFSQIQRQASCAADPSGWNARRIRDGSGSSKPHGLLPFPVSSHPRCLSEIYR